MENKLFPDLLFRMEGQKELAQLVANSIPNHFIENPETTFADLSMGGGQYLSAIVEQCLRYHKLEQILPRIYGWESSRLFTNRAILHNNLRGANLNVETPQTNMKFNVIIGNPPYQDVTNKAKNNKLWMKFIHQAFDMCSPGGSISLVTPTSFVGLTQVPSRNRQRLLDEFNLTKVDYTADESFNVGVDICYWNAIKESYSGQTLVCDDTGERIIDLREELPLPTSKMMDHNLSEKIAEVIRLDSTLKLTGVWGESEEADEGPKVFWSGRNKKKTVKSLPNNTGKIKLVASFSASYHKWFVTTDGVSGWNKMWMVDSVEEGLEIGETFSQPVLQFFMNTWRKTAGFTPAIKLKNMIPDLRGMTDDEVNKLFNLTSEEVEYIYSNHKPSQQIERVLSI